MEVERGYTEAVRILLGNKMEDVNGTLEEIPGTTERALPLLQEFTSHDCDTAVIKDDLEKLFQGNEKSWESVGPGKWLRNDLTS